MKRGMLFQRRERILEEEEKGSSQWTLNTLRVKTEFFSDSSSRAFLREARQSADQRRRRITLHCHSKNLALNK